MKTLFWIVFAIIAVAIFILILKRKNEDKTALVIAYLAIVLTSIDHVSKLGAALFDTDLEIESVTPICVVDDHVFCFEADTVTFHNIGMYLVVEVQNGNRPTYLTSVEISGNLSLKPNQFITPSNEGLTLNELEALYEQEKPYYQISWIAWPYQQNGEYKLEPFEHKFLIFELWEPIASGQRETGFQVPLERYFGSNGNQPELIHGYPSVDDFCLLEWGRGGIPSEVRPEFLSDSISLSLRSGYDYYEISKEDFCDLVRVWEDEWEEQNLSRILHPGDREAY